MKVCVVGAGSIGGLLAAKLAGTGNPVTVIARGAHLAAIRENGLRLIDEDGRETAVRVDAFSRMAEAGPQDLVVLGVKAHQLVDIVTELASLYHSETAVMTAQNGIPWWFFRGFGGALEGRNLETVDPGGAISRTIPVARVVGSVVYPAAEIVAPGTIKHIEGTRFSLGEVAGEPGQRIERISRLLQSAGLRAPVVADIRSELMVKLWGNMSFNPISALTHATLEEICRFPATRDLAAGMMAETQRIGEALGLRFRVSLERRLAGAEAVGAHKTSMLQDVEAGRRTEVEALVGSIVELGGLLGIETPRTEAVYSMMKLLEATMARHRGRIAIQSL